jgi:hypothetical protein
MHRVDAMPGCTRMIAPDHGRIVIWRDNFLRSEVRAFATASRGTSYEK